MTATEAREIMNLSDVPTSDELKPLVSYINARIALRAADKYDSINVTFRQSTATVERVATYYRNRGYLVMAPNDKCLRIEW